MELGGERDDVVGKTAYRRRLQQTVELYSVLCRNSDDVLRTVAPTLDFPVVLLWFFWGSICHTSFTKYEFMFLYGN